MNDHPGDRFHWFLAFIVAFRPSLASVTLVAQQADT